MSFTSTIWRYSSSNMADWMIFAPSCEYPCVRNCNALATLSGVFTSPSLSGFSPNSRRISLTWTAISAVVFSSYISFFSYDIFLSSSFGTVVETASKPTKLGKKYLLL